MIKSYGEIDFLVRMDWLRKCSNIVVPSVGRVIPRYLVMVLFMILAKVKFIDLSYIQCSILEVFQYLFSIFKLVFLVCFGFNS